MSNFYNVQKKLGVEFNDIGLLQTALVHRSYINENYDIVEHNERLEFLGDAVLELIVTEYLFKNYDKDEGELTNWRSALVRTENLAIVSRALDLGSFLFLSKGEERSGGREKDHILANVFEAVVGAIYLDSGYDITKQFIEENILVHLDSILAEKKHIDAKSSLQEITQEKLSITPNYKLVSDSGPDHNKVFVMGVYFNDELVAKGEGSSKQNAEQDAAQNALELKGWNK